jgi:hypothetical protein
VSFPPVPSTEITKDGKNLSPAWIAFFSQVFSNGGISAAAVNSGTPTFSGNVTVTNLTVTGTSSVAGAAGFAGPVAFSNTATFAADATFSGLFQTSNTASFNGATSFNSTAQFNGATTFWTSGSVSFQNGFTSTTGTFTSLITGTTLTLSGLATFNAGVTGTDADFTTGTLGNFSFSGDDLTSSPVSGGSGQMNFYTLNTDIPASVLAMNIDNQQRLNFPAVSLIGGPPGLTNPTNFYQQGRSFLDNISPPSTTNTYAASNVFAPANIAADNTGVVYTYGITMYIGGALQESTNVTIDEELALVINSGNSVFSNTLFIGAGAGSVATSDAQGVFCSQGVLGYGKDPFTFSPGGAVTQLTSKSTGVTLNKGCGAITMNNAALNAGTSVEFVLTNSFIAATDTVVCNMGPGGTASTYLVQCQAVAAGSCRFRVSNYSATNRSEACVVNFSIIKATNA